MIEIRLVAEAKLVGRVPNCSAPLNSLEELVAETEVGEVVILAALVELALIDRCLRERGDPPL